MISEGGISGTVVDPKKIFKIALDNHASGIMRGYNYPSGAAFPSETDQKITKKIVMLDYLIITDEGFYSFADEGAL